MIYWGRATKADHEAASAVVDKYEETTGLYVGNRMTTLMDLVVCHTHGCPLDWDALLNADRFTLMHDITGIAQHLNRDNGVLQNCFLPRCARKGGEE